MRKNLKEARLAAGMTQQQMAEKLQNGRIVYGGQLIVCEDGTVFKKYKDGYMLFESKTKSPYIAIAIKINGEQKIN